MTLKQLLPLLLECQRIGARIEVRPHALVTGNILNAWFDRDEVQEIEWEIEALIIGALKEFAKGKKMYSIKEFDDNRFIAAFYGKDYEGIQTSPMVGELEAFLRAFVATFGGKP